MLGEPHLQSHVKRHGILGLRKALDDAQASVDCLVCAEVGKGGSEAFTATATRWPVDRWYRRMIRFVTRHDGNDQTRLATNERTLQVLPAWRQHCTALHRTGP